MTVSALAEPIKGWRPWLVLLGALILLDVEASRNRPASDVVTPLARSEPHPCPYLDGREACSDYIWAATVTPGGYQRLLDQGFRRSGRLIYRSACPACAECVPIRVPVDRFRPSRSQKRVLHRNLDVTVEAGPPRCTRTRWRVYAAYLQRRHDGAMSAGFNSMRTFLYDSPTETLEMTYRVGRRIVAAGILDVAETCLSSVYFFFDPAESWRSLGVFGAWCEIEECRRRGLPYWYIGLYIRGCRKMSYKADYRPHELLGADGRWRLGAGQAAVQAAF